MKVLAIFACLVVGAVVVQGICKDDLHRIKVQTQWNAVYNTHRDVVGKAAFRSLFKLAPDSRALFSKFDSDDTNSPKFQAHCARVLGGLGNVISELGDAEVYTSQLGHLAAFHSNIPNLKYEYFEQLGQVLEEIFSAAIDDYDNEAWADCYTDIIQGMTAQLQ
ncbi:unnamed protein product [Owenia fusiformis]|uniref:Extracellular globin n=1 Tax=Owenia fusiformis TaxID=6347 RepID=A0A8J1XZE9_OWEFU|nr:unnamed protein product [Owenia fusiformis]